MSIEQTIKDTLAAKMKDGTVEKLVSDHLESGIKSALESLFRSYGDATKAIENQVKSVIVPYLESYDYSKYIVKLDHVLTEILKNTNSENNLLLENFKDVMSNDNKLETIKVTELFDKWIKYVEKNVETDGLEIVYDEGVSYEQVDVRFEFIMDYERASWSSFETGKLIFECDHDEEMNFELDLSRWKSDRKEGYDIVQNKQYGISSLKHINKFELLLMKLGQDGTKIIIDDESDSDEVTPDKEPEASFS